MEVESDINEIRKKMVLKKYHNMSSEADDKSKNQIMDIIKVLTQEEPEEVQAEQKILFKGIDKMMFQRQWRRLPMIHKIMKIKEYVLESLLECDNKDEVLDVMIDAVQNKLLKNKDVKYDPLKGRIIAIPRLGYNNIDKVYEFN